VTTIVAVILLSCIALLSLLILGLVGLASRHNAQLDIETTTAANPLKLVFRIKYTPEGRQPLLPESPVILPGGRASTDSRGALSPANAESGAGGDSDVT
jgi:hypothetical protein